MSALRIGSVDEDDVLEGVDDYGVWLGLLVSEAGCLQNPIAKRNAVHGPKVEAATGTEDDFMIVDG